MYAGLVAAAIALGVLAAGLPSAHHDAKLSASAATTPTSLLALPSTTSTTATTVPAPTTTTTVGTHAPAAVTLLVANASAINGAATKLTQTLGGAGYKTLTAAGATKKLPATNVYYVAGYQNDAAAIAARIGAPAVSVLPLPAALPVKSVAGANVVVMLGGDLAPSVH